MLRNPALCHLEWVSWEPIIINIIIRHRYSDQCKIGQQNMTGEETGSQINTTVFRCWWWWWKLVNWFSQQKSTELNIYISSQKSSKYNALQKTIWKYFVTKSLQNHIFGVRIIKIWGKKNILHVSEVLCPVVIDWSSPGADKMMIFAQNISPCLEPDMLLWLQVTLSSVRQIFSSFISIFIPE